MRGYVDRLYPYALGVAVFVAFWRWGGDIQAGAVDANIDLLEVFSATFDVATLFTGLLFSIYVLAIAPGGGFIERIFTTKTFALFKRYTIEAMLAGSAASVISVFLRSLQSIPAPLGLKWSIIFAAWGALTTVAVLTFYRVAKAFYVFAQQDSRLKRSRP